MSQDTKGERLFNAFTDGVRRLLSGLRKNTQDSDSSIRPLAHGNLKEFPTTFTLAMATTDLDIKLRLRAQVNMLETRVWKIEDMVMQLERSLAQLSRTELAYEVRETAFLEIVFWNQVVTSKTGLTAYMNQQNYFTREELAGLFTYGVADEDFGKRVKHINFLALTSNTGYSAI